MKIISFARVCVEIYAKQPRCTLVDVVLNGVSRSVTIEYEWRLVECPSCGTFGHRCADIPTTIRLKSAMQQVQANTTSSVSIQILDPTLMVVEAPGEPEQGWKQVQEKKKKPLLPKEGPSSRSVSSSEEGQILKLKGSASEKGLLSTSSRKALRGLRILSKSEVSLSSPAADKINLAKASTLVLLNLGAKSNVSASLISNSDEDLLSPCPFPKASPASRRVDTMQDKLLTLALDSPPFTTLAAPMAS